MRRPLDRAVLYLGLFETVLVFPAIVVVLWLPAGWLNYVLIAYIVLFGSFNDFERIEHVASHTTRGKILVGQSPVWWAKTMDLLRRYFVWPLFGWFPDYYYVSHALHHHVENNGPADWQSSIRYNRASLLDFTKSATWLGINWAVPLETSWYLLQTRRYRPLRILWRGILLYWALLALVAFLEPALFAILVMQRILAGIDLYVFSGRWHGLHDVNRPYDVEAANQSLVHYAHHANPRVHLLDEDALYQVTQETPTPSAQVLLRPEYAQDAGFWNLQALLWKKDFEGAADALIERDTLAEEDKANQFRLRPGLTGRGIGASRIEQLVGSSFPSLRPEWLVRLDERVSNAIGSIVMQRASRATGRSRGE